MDLMQMGQKAKEAARKMNCMDTATKNRGLLAAAKALVANAEVILTANAQDVCNAKEAGMSAPLVDRLQLTDARIRSMAEGLEQIAGLEDPVGEVLSMWQRPNGLMIGQKRVPLGVIGIIYESRPNVTADAFGLCFKAGNAVILKGGSDALYSNQAIVQVIQNALTAENIDADCIQLITDTDRETTAKMMRMNEYIDVLIPRGGAGLIRAVVQNATVPVIETGTGNCHVYVDETADFEMALNIIDNAKTQRTGVCNACESVIVHSSIADTFIKAMAERLSAKSVEMRGDERAMAASEAIVPATEEDWGTEYLNLILSVKTVDSIEEAIAHINRYNTGHSESIVTKDYANAQKFLNEVDAAAVYVNASTRFTDGFEFGFGAEIGISTQKLHARGPMGLKELTSTKYIIYGNGQIR